MCFKAKIYLPTKFLSVNSLIGCMILFKGNILLLGVQSVDPKPMFGRAPAGV